MNIPNAFWSRTNELIKKQDTKQEAIADTCGINYQTFRSWVTRSCYPDALQTYLIAQALDTTVEYLVTGKPPAFTDKYERLKAIILKDLQEN